MKARQRTGAELEKRVAAVRGFNRFYTQLIGALEERLLSSPFSLAQARVVYELAQRDRPTAAALAGELGLDPGYLSRILRSLRKRRVVARVASRTDGRSAHLSLTARGRSEFRKLNARSHGQIRALLATVGSDEQRRLAGAMSEIVAILQPQRPGERQPRAYRLRAPEPGDMGWVVETHGRLYAEEYGWDRRFEGLVAEIVAEFVERFDPSAERCWIAERDGRRAGCVFLVRKSKTVAKLRLLIVEPHARGVGIGTQLVDECIAFARSAGYRKIVLWTNSVLEAARAIYLKAGFRLVAREAHHSFGRDLIGETWELRLGSA
ncbi:MAG: bifunctional helix-turn-helix transcriptional regulator/GNAT family N-acetyltransferase [Candidatus Eremiobacteraeota bacterium]|nr:bifunctional helix-turn-helix transcriptional regulator/GNAT family N-acetyltransferase [Candidatus Eremiobacteraeota bacterium]